MLQLELQLIAAIAAPRARVSVRCGHGEAA